MGEPRYPRRDRGSRSLSGRSRRASRCAPGCPSTGRCTPWWRTWTCTRRSGRRRRVRPRPAARRSQGAPGRFRGPSLLLPFAVVLLLGARGVDGAARSPTALRLGRRSLVPLRLLFRVVLLGHGYRSSVGKWMKKREHPSLRRPPPDLGISLRGRLPWVAISLHLGVLPLLGAVTLFSAPDALSNRGSHPVGAVTQRTSQGRVTPWCAPGSVSSRSIAHGVRPLY